MEMLKSGFGWLFAGIYSLIVLFGVFEFLRTPPEPMKEFALLILTLPGSFLLSAVIENIGLVDDQSAPSWFPVLVLFGAIVNSAVLYALGFALGLRLDYRRSRKMPG
jgi:hypothetical protein